MKKLLLILLFAVSAYGQYPTAIDTALTIPPYSEYRTTYLTSAITSGAATATVNSTNNWIFNTYVIQIDSELILATKTGVTAISLVTRGLGGTVPAAHNNFARVNVVWSSFAWNASRDSLIALETKLGLGISNASGASAGWILGVSSPGNTGWAPASTFININSLLPSQGGNSGKYLTTNGSVASWASVAGGSGAWGSITGTLSNQTDLQTALDGKLSTTGNALTASAFAANPTDCAANNFATTIDASGNLTCAQPTVAVDTIFDAKGDLIAGTGVDASSKLTVGPNDTFLVADSSQVTGLRWLGGSSARLALGLGTIALQNDTGTTIDSGVFTSKIKLPRVTALPGTPSAGDTVIVTDDSATGACDSAAGSAQTFCQYNGSAWVSLGDGGGGGFTAASTTEQLTGTETTKGSTPDSVAALWEQGADVASAATISLGEGGYFNVTGTTGISDIDFATDKTGRKACLKFADALVLTHASTLILPASSANITTSAGDVMCLVSEGTDIVRVVSYQRANGRALDYDVEGVQDFSLGQISDTDTIDFIYDDINGTASIDARTQMSITSDASGLKLSGDAASPGNNQYYGTNASGTKGFFALATSGLVSADIDTCAELAAIMTDETGTCGGFVLSTSPTITTPRIVTSINDSNGNEAVKLTATASAVNEITVANAATGTGPTISVTGDDANADLNFAAKGTGTVKIGGTGTGFIGLFDTDQSHYLTITPGSNLTADRTLTVTTGDAARTLTMSGDINVAANLTTSGANALTLTTTGATNVTLPTTGTLATLAGTESLTNKKLGSLTSNGFVKTSAGDGTLSVDTNTYTTAASTTEVLTGTDSAKAGTPDAVAALWEQGADVASAGTVSLGEGGHFNITGTTTITDIDFATDKAGRKASLKFAGALTLTHNASTLILPNAGSNITTAAGDTAVIVSEGTDAIRVVSYQRADGTALVTAGGGQSSIQFKDEGSNLGSSGAITSVDCVGTGITCTHSTNAITMTVSGGGSSTFYRDLLNGSSLNPDTSGNVFLEPYTVKATNDFFKHNVWVFNNPTADLKLYGTFELPAACSSGSAFKMVWSSTATTGTLQYSLAYRVITGDDTNSLDQATAVETVTGSDTAPGATDRRMEVTITPTNSNFSTAGTVQWILTRVDTSDTLAAAITLHGLRFTCTP